MHRTVRLCLPAFLIVGVSVAREPGTASEPSGVTKSEVLIIGTDHAPTCFFTAPGYTNSHIRVALQKFQPTMIGVESNPLWFSRGILNRVTYESQVGVSWAVKHNIPVYGVDWQKLEDLAESSRRGLKLARQPAPQPRTLKQLRQEAIQIAKYAGLSRTSIVEHPSDLFRWLNTEGAEQLHSAEAPRAKGTEAGIRMLQALEYRDARIAEHILTLLRRYPGGKLAVLVGAGHKWPLEQILSRQPDIKVVSWASLPISTQEEIAAAWEPLDSLGTLRESLDSILYYFNPEGVDLSRVRDHLGRLAQAGIDNEEVQYFRARYLVLMKKYDEAEELLRALARSNTGKGFSYRLTNGWWEFAVSFMAQIELAKIQDLKGHRQQALAGYREALSNLEKIAPPIPPDESFRDIEAWTTDAGFAFSRVWSYQCARQALQTLIQEPFSSLYDATQNQAQ
jgi:hypothetical protein